MAEHDRDVMQLVGTMRDRTTTAQELQNWRAQLVQQVLRVMLLVGLLALLAGSYYRLTQRNIGAVAAYALAYAVLAALTLVRKIDYKVRVWGMLFLLYLLAVADFVSDGRAGGARLFLAALIFAAVLFLGKRAGIYVLTGALITNALFAAAFLTGFLPLPAPVSSGDLAGWVSSIFVLAILGIFIVASVNYLIPRLIDAMAQSGHLARELTDYQTRLEDLITQQEIDLDRRSTQLNTAAQVAREAAQFQDLDQLLDRTVHFISDRFGFYHAGIFLLDESGAYAVLQAASSEGGQVMLARGHRLKVGEMGIVGYAAGKGEPRIALDVGEDAIFFDNPDLPGTRSEIAWPLHSREGVIGVLDVQSTDPEAFTEDDVVVLQTLADQVALVIRNAQLIQEAENRLAAQQQMYQYVGAKAWRDLLSRLDRPGFKRNAQGISAVDEAWRPRMLKALHKGQLVSDSDADPAVAVPIKVRGQVIGVIEARKDQKAGPWTQDELELLETLGAQLDPALDSAQLYQDSQLRANRERFTREIADKMRRAPDMETLIQTTLEELSAVLDVSSTFVQLVEASELDISNEDTDLI